VQKSKQKDKANAGIDSAQKSKTL